MPCEAIWTEPAIEAACREWYALRRELRANHRQLIKDGRLFEVAEAVNAAEKAAIEALGTTVERAVALRDLGVSVLLQPTGGLYVHDPRLRASDDPEWQVY